MAGSIHHKFYFDADSILPDTPHVSLIEASFKSASVEKTRVYRVAFRKQNTNELKTGTIKVRAAVKDVISTFNRYGWGLIKIKEVKGE